MRITHLEDKSNNKNINRNISSNYKCMQPKPTQTETYPKIKMRKHNSNSRGLLNNNLMQRSNN
jgi:hypothetical protein